MKTRFLTPTLVFLCVAPLACSKDASLGDDRQAQTATEDDDAMAPADDDAFTPDDDATVTADDDALVPDDDATATTDDDTSMSDDDMSMSDDDMSMSDDDVPTEPEPGPAPALPTAPSTDASAPVDEPNADAGSPDCAPGVCSEECPEECPAAGLVSENFLANRYDPEKGCFELRMEVAGTQEVDPNNPISCGAAFTLGQAPDGTCWGFNSTCQPEGFEPIRTNPSAPVGVDHECVDAPACPLEWTCDPGVLPPELDRSCESDDDCYGQLWTGFCGCTASVFAFNKRDVSALSAYRDTCVDTSMCECPVPPRLTDSGEAVGTLSDALIECVAGACVTRRDPEYCIGAEECIHELGQCIPTDATSCRSSTGDCATCQ